MEDYSNMETSEGISAAPFEGSEKRLELDFSPLSPENQG